MDLEFLFEAGEDGHNVNSFIKKFLVLSQIFRKYDDQQETIYALNFQVHRAVSERKQIVFTGHSAGGAIATLATVWLLEQFRKPDDCKQNLPLCMTFGSPLIGDCIFGHALSRENWSRCFLNFVMRYDIVPRISLSPIKSIEQDFQSILVFLNPKSSYSTLDTIGKSQQAISLFTTVMRNASSVANLRACVDMGCTNMLLQEIPGFIQLCPYRPFGTYMFSTGNGRLVGVNNSDAVLHLLFFSLQLGPEQELAEVAYRSIKEHLAYGSEVKECLEMQDVVFLDRLEEIPLSSDDGFCDGMQSINMALRDLGLVSFLCLSFFKVIDYYKLEDTNAVFFLISLRECQRYGTTCKWIQIVYSVETEFKTK